MGDITFVTHSRFQNEPLRRSMMGTDELTPPGQIILLHGSPRSGKSSILQVIQDTFDGPWMNLGFDAFIFHVRPGHYLPGGKYFALGPHYWEDDETTNDKRHVLGSHAVALIAGMYESIAVHSRLGFNVVADVVHPDVSHRQILQDGIQRLEGLPVLFVGVRCPLETNVERRNIGQAGRGRIYGTSSDGEPIPRIALWWDREIHVQKIYDLEVDTSLLSPEACAEMIRNHLDTGPPPSAFRQLGHQFAG
jgi:chloramphenicol 3-O phosphotransferase